jgi:two-component system phosphate regulon sensor histidine kinase PhoR
VVRDITQEKELAEQKSAFLANASHELRTPLTNFKTRLYLLRKQPARLEDHVAILDRVTDRMTSLVEDLLDASRFERGVIPLQQDDVILQPLIEDVVLLQQPEAQRKNIHVIMNLADNPVHVYADANRIVQVLVNLVVNAINYTDNEGRVSVDLLEQENMAIIRVQDTGMGIIPEHLPRVFEAFFRGSEGSIQGTGLGLYISKQIVDLHHGSLTVDSKRGEGTTFTVCLPLTDPDLNESDKIAMFK